MSIQRNAISSNLTSVSNEDRLIHYTYVVSILLSEFGSSIEMDRPIPIELIKQVAPQLMKKPEAQAVKIWNTVRRGYRASNASNEEIERWKQKLNRIIEKLEAKTKIKFVGNYPWRLFSYPCGHLEDVQPLYDRAIAEAFIGCPPDWKCSWECGKISNYDMYAAIEMVILVHEPSWLFQGEALTTNVVPLIESNLNELVIFIYMWQLRNIFEKKRKDEQPPEQTALPLQPSRELNVDELSRLQESLNEANAKLSAAEAELTKLRRENRMLKYSAEKANSNIAIKNSALPCPTIGDIQQTSAEEPRLKEPPAHEDLLPLPETGIVFLGGHQRVIAKLKELHPKWIFMTDTSPKVNCLLSSTNSVHAVFVVTTYLSHGLYQHVEAAIGKDVPKFYVTSTNIELLEKDMQKQYSLAVRTGKLARTA